MASKRIVVGWITCFREDDESHKSSGFQVSGYKDQDTEKKDAKVGFILSGVKIISFQQMMPSGSRTRIKWIPNGFEIREELHKLDETSYNGAKKNNIVFVDKNGSSPVVMQGEPVIHDNTFSGQMVKIHWLGNGVKIYPLQAQLSFQCILNPKNHRVDCIVT
ncbi:MAG: hypothetical protein ACTSW1_05270 [Candidatus Hodarchaeales archaeon]